jgi:hypothetical protein
MPVALVTGAIRGVGRGAATSLHEAGSRYSRPAAASMLQNSPRASFGFAVTTYAAPHNHRRGPCPGFVPKPTQTSSVLGFYFFGSNPRPTRKT